MAENLSNNEQPEVVVKEETTVVVPPQATNASASATPPPRIKPKFVARRKRAGMFDVPEIVALGVSGFLLVAVVLMYLFWLLPARERLRARDAERDQLEKNYSDLQEKVGENTSTQDSVVNILDSLGRFEMNYLSAPAQGKAALFSRINELIRNNGLRNTAGPDYAPLETVALEKYGTKEQTGRAKLQSIYPGTVVGLTVEGGYGNLRRFISDLENSRQFIVISAIEIEAEGGSFGGGSGGGTQIAIDNNTVRNAPQSSGIPSSIVPAPPGDRPGMVNPRAAQNNPAQAFPPAAGGQPVARPTSRGSIVSLKLELVAYFNRNADAASASPVAPRNVRLQN
jgi:Tfp pilus assembly protein PilO